MANYLQPPAALNHLFSAKTNNVCESDTLLKGIFGGGHRDIEMKLVQEATTSKI